MTTLKEFEEALREQGMDNALAVLEKLKERDRAKRSVAPARRVTGRKMTPDLAQQIVILHENTKMTQQEIAFKLGVNQGRVNEVIKRGKWLSGDPQSPEAIARDEALERAAKGVGKSPKPAGERKPAARKKKAEKLEQPAAEVQAAPVEAAPAKPVPEKPVPVKPVPEDKAAAAAEAKAAKAARKFKPEVKQLTFGL
ncbi:hypothetical protein SAE02_49510 [Skermanella aerolata]|uniref:RNA polymerase sigma-70 region 4 domain-containing protein n=1 Tax=Skermanella aerolata TaxID=393310 RepID=A0A512DWG2_9PROT|nr:hypothetical protein [Skermanella aerolata]KJB95522.1 RNA polymerase subunit sigma-70 [Skermanella aerolata KACC 11604]GEO40803.1 hypothetical protein SAE02_49510 [Skermanella aerolata]